jgi:hypothetical protein
MIQQLRRIHNLFCPLEMSLAPGTLVVPSPSWIWQFDIVGSSVMLLLHLLHGGICVLGLESGLANQKNCQLQWTGVKDRTELKDLSEPPACRSS